ncbi:MAG: TonB-dependent receptor [Candidatus Andeanibacterium colombiense]|uniref:TonB-dependent receptor n=1 Tax=Candidatus Andeanibacterium colombiense TaxID=3121345 RepID=A0AAJ5X288_9SPHN|nr:MAG: TonB-dependent receptor [Sphingomonadaceae bacterium]
MKIGFRKAWLLSGVMGLAAFGTGAARAQETGPAAGAEPGTIIVTAQKREQAVQDVPIALTALSGDDLQKAGVQSLDEITKQIPSLQMQDNGIVARFSMRGINLNSISDASESPILVAFDGVAYGSSSNFSATMYDIDRVEVLRGPQGTLYGRNATGGLVNIISKRPTDTFEGYFSGQYGNFGRAVFEGAVSGPITDGVRFRASAKSDTDNGIQTNILNGDKWWENDQFAGRLQLEFDLPNRGNLLLKAHYENLDGIGQGYGLFGNRDPDSGPGYAAVCPVEDTLAGLCVDNKGTKGTGDPTKIISGNTPPAIHRSSWGVSSELNYPLTEVLDLVSITAYDELEKYKREDADGSADAGNTIGSGNDYWQFSQELRLQGKGDKFNWVAGLFYFNSDAHVTSDFGFFPAPQGDLGYSDVKTESFAAFVDGTYGLTDRLNLSLGARYTHEEKEHVGLNLAPLVLAFITPKVEVPFDFKSKDDVITWRAVLDYHPVQDVMVYASVATGFKAPGFQTQYLFSTDPYAAAPSQREEVTTYELGLKSSALDRKLTFNAAAYYSDYRGLQQVLTVPSPIGVNTPVLTNVDKAILYGLEADLTYTPSPYFDVIAGGSYVHSKIEDPGTAYDGHVVSAAPKFTYSVTARAHLPLGEDGDATFQASYRWQDQTYFNLNQDPLLGFHSYGLLDLRLSVTPPNRTNFRIEAFVNNTLNQKYWVHAFSSGAIGGGTVPIWGMPRNYGLKATVQF